MTTGLILFGTVLMVLAEVLHEAFKKWNKESIEKDDSTAAFVILFLAVFATGYTLIIKLGPSEDLLNNLSFAVLHFLGLLGWIGRK